MTQQIQKVRSADNQLKLNDLTAMISEIAPQFDLISRGGYFAMEGKTQNEVMFDRESDELVISGTSSRRGRDGKPASGRAAQVYRLGIPHFKEIDAIYVDDLEGYRLLGTADQAKTLGTEKAKRLMKLRAITEQSHELQRFFALTGISKDPHGNTLFDPFAEFGITRKEVDFTLGTAQTNIDEKIDEIITHQVDTMNMGVALGLPHVYVSKAFFNALTNHATIKDVYRDYAQADGVQRLRDNLTDFYVGFKVRTFYHRGVLFIEYNPTFKVAQADGSVANVQVMDEAAKEGFAVPTSTGGALAPIYRGFLGPERKLTSVGNSTGVAMFAREYRDVYDEKLELEVESNPLFICTKPQGVVRVFSSN